MPHLGQCLEAPKGLRGLKQDRHYYYVGRHGQPCTVTLCFFSASPVCVYLEKIRSSDFELALERGHLTPVENAPEYPPWVAEHLHEDDNSAPTAKSLQGFLESNSELIEKRVENITPLIEKAEKILCSDNPFKEINKYARNHEPELNQQRTRTHFFAYLCFGYSGDALAPATWGNGRWNREAGNSTQKLGRKNKRTGEFSGFRLYEADTELCIEGYRKHSAVGRPYTEIYEDTLRDQFECTTRTVDGVEEIYQPDGKPYPSFGQFKPRITRHFGKEYLDKRRWGKNRARRTKREERGPFTEHITALMERIEGDAFYAKATTRGQLADHMPQMCIVRLIDGLSANRLGIGASLNGEKSGAYAMAYFSMGMEKTRFCRLFGIDIKQSQWPSYGLPQSYILDRGSGTKASLLDAIIEIVPHIELAPSSSGQSKAISESTHPRSTHTDGNPIYEIADGNYLDYFKRQIIETIDEISTSDVSSRRGPELIDARVKARPIDLWNYFDHRFRTHAVSVPEEKLIRSFLPKRKCKIKRSGAWIDTVRFRSDQLSESRLCERVTGNRSFTVEAYILPLSLRQIWIDFDGDLIESYLVPSTQGGVDDVDMTVQDLERMNEIRRDLQAEAKEQDLAIKIALAELYETQTGRPASGTRQQTRRPKRKTPRAMDELAIVQTLFGMK